ncbi:MAG: GntR family transcriptional regulator [Alphaproteobacteria bacterium]|nr:GntR family transcriptional regulator [Alphaproteobacteria bacterium]
MADVKARYAERDSIHDRIYEHLREALIYGELEAGEKISVRSIATAFGVSMTPARDALKRLVWERGLDHLPNGTFRVPLLDRAEIEALREQSKLYEELLVRKAMPNVTDKLILELEILWGRAKMLLQKGSVTEGRKLIRQLRFKLFEASNSSWLIEAAGRVWLRRGPSAAATYARYVESIERVAPDFQPRLLQAARNRDADAAAAQIAAGTDHFFNFWLASLDQVSEDDREID